MLPNILLMLLLKSKNYYKYFIPIIVFGLISNIQCKVLFCWTVFKNKLTSGSNRLCIICTSSIGLYTQNTFRLLCSCHKCHYCFLFIQINNYRNIA
uniref:Secreted protein n=1 Tax=Heterorhabditis bacteriophora TaxID=37862 RepID=A0A1I7WKF6_HETBA